MLITSVWPDPRGNGLARRAWMWAATLGLDHHLHTVFIGNPPVSQRETTKTPGDLVVISLPRETPKPRSPEHWFQPPLALKKELLAGVPAEMPARVVLFRFYMHEVLSLLPPSWRGRAEVDCDDLESMTRRSLAHLALRRLRLREARHAVLSALRYQTAERAFLGEYSCVHVAAEEDRATLAVRLGDRVRVTPNRICSKSINMAAAPGGACHALFVGTLSYLPNEDAALWLAEKIFPHLRQLDSGATLTIVGGGAPELMRRLTAAGASCPGLVDDLTPWYHASNVAFVPLRGGGGTKIKMLEAWLHRRPVVSTSHGARGLNAVHGKHLLTANTAKGLAMAARRLRIEEGLSERVTETAYRLLQAEFLLPSVHV